MNNYAGQQLGAQQNATYGYLNPQQALPQGLPETAPVSILEAQVKRLTGSAQDIDVAATRLHALADRLTGSEPTDPGKAGLPAPNPVSSIGKLNEAHEWLETSRARLSQAISRLERL